MSDPMSNVIPLSERVAIAGRHVNCCDDCVNIVHRLTAALRDRLTDDQIRELIERLAVPR